MSEKHFLTFNLTGLCTGKFFRPVFECPEKSFSTSPPNSSPKIFLLQGIIGFRRAILADTPQLKGANFAPEPKVMY
jgi:hypothetical protein